MKEAKIHGRQIKKKILQHLQQDPFDKELDEICRLPLKATVSPLFSFLCNIDELIKWRAVTALGKVVSDLAASDLESAMARVKHYAAPVNNIRYGFKNPCVETGLCNDCKSPTRICNMWSIIEGHMIEKRIHVKLIGESVGY